MNNFYTKTLDAGLDAYEHPFQEMPKHDWKYMIDRVFKDPNREARKKAGKLNREVVPYGHTTGSRSFATVMTIATDREEQRIANEGNDAAGNDNEPNSNEGSGNEGRKKLDICDLFEASHRLRDTNEWINSICKDKHEMMVATRDEAALSGTPLSAEELSIKCLGESKTKNYIRGLGNGPKPSTYLSKFNSQSACQNQLQKLQCELDLIREKQRREREEEKTRREEEQRRREDKYEEDKRRWEETQRRQDEERSIFLKEMEVFKSFMSQMQNGGRGNMGAG
ncbi:vicilin-like seed storage protein At2g18540 isoform X2 [Rhododendron vialii]|uniref:vicilin-like seed storage protein At2g18540 isoform X2 n=1 Tax=Rhododendron vialii TaxID=182163 RepID=UPI00265FFD55|nr:vicilin-like seed storage protein At2g18540 isoform X2 [Rhododendron vialii]